MNENQQTVFSKVSATSLGLEVSHSRSRSIPLGPAALETDGHALPLLAQAYPVCKIHNTN